MFLKIVKKMLISNLLLSFYIKSFVTYTRMSMKFLHINIDSQLDLNSKKATSMDLDKWLQQRKFKNRIIDIYIQYIQKWIDPKKHIYCLNTAGKVKSDEAKLGNKRANFLSLSSSQWATVKRKYSC